MPILLHADQQGYASCKQNLPPRDRSTRILINGEAPPQRPLAERTEIPSSVSKNRKDKIKMVPVPAAIMKAMGHFETGASCKFLANNRR